jgi:hypothetical protein
MSELGEIVSIEIVDCAFLSVIMQDFAAEETLFAIKNHSYMGVLQ